MLWFSIVMHEFGEQPLTDMESYLRMIDSRAPDHLGSVSVDLANLRLLVRQGIWNPSRGKSTKMFLDAMDAKGHADVRDGLDIGTGSGILGLKMKLAGVANVTVTDIDAQSLENARQNADALGLSLTCVQSDLFERVEGTFDRILFNAPATHPLRRSPEAKTRSILWSPEANILRRFLNSLPPHLRPGGSALLMYSRFDDFDPLSEDDRRAFSAFHITPILESRGDHSLSQVLDVRWR